MKKEINKKSVMSRAWEIYRENSDNEIKAVFSLCLKMAWEPVLSVLDVIEAWEYSTDTSKMNMLTACVKKAAKNEIAYSVEDNYNGYNELVLWANRHLDELVNETFCKLAPKLNVEYLRKLNAKRDAEGKKPVTLIALVYGAAKNSIMTQYNQEVKHVRAILRTTTNSDGQEYNYFDTIADTRAPSTEAAALANVMIDELINSRDAIDKAIIEGKLQGYTERDIGKRVDISGVAVHKRIDKIRDSIREQSA